MLNNYNRIARIYPAILCSIPIFLLNYFLLNFYTAKFVLSLQAITWAGGITVYVALTFLLTQIARFIGKELFENSYFKDESEMPTTNFLLHADVTYSSQHKEKIHSKILTDFGIKIYSPDEESRDTVSARKIVMESISMVRGKAKDGRLILKHNREYGFTRNLIGGSVPAVYLSILNICLFGIFFPNPLAYYLSIFLALTYLFIIIISKYVIGRYGVRYAKVLIQEYLLT